VRTWAADELATKLRVRDPFFGAPLAHIWTKNDATSANAVRVRYAAMMLSPQEKNLMHEPSFLICDDEFVSPPA
jgi:hypothetical protein